MNPIVAWLLALSLNFAPPARSHQFPGWEETEAQRTARYEQIAKDIYEVVYDKKNKPIPGMSRARTAAFMLALAIGESGLDPDADRGPCYRAPGWQLRCDGGNAASMWQVRLGKGFVYGENDAKIYQKHLFADRKLALWVALRAVRGSFWACRKHPANLRLSVYGGGSCSNKAAQIGSTKRYKLAQKLWDFKKIPVWAPEKDPQKPEEKVAKSDLTIASPPVTLESWTPLVAPCGSTWIAWSPFGTCMGSGLATAMPTAAWRSTYWPGGMSILLSR